MKPSINISLNGLQGRITFYEDPTLMTRCAARPSEVMLYKHYFELDEALARRSIGAATVLREDVIEFKKLVDPDKRSPEEHAFVDDMEGLDFMIAVDASIEGEDILLHELCHVLYFYDAEHRRAVHEAWDRVQGFDRGFYLGWLENAGYHQEEMIDEWFANFYKGYDGMRYIITPGDYPPVFHQTKALLTKVLSDSVKELR